MYTSLILGPLVPLDLMPREFFPYTTSGSGGDGGGTGRHLGLAGGILLPGWSVV